MHTTWSELPSKQIPFNPPGSTDSLWLRCDKSNERADRYAMFESKLTCSSVAPLGHLEWKEKGESGVNVWCLWTIQWGRGKWSWMEESACVGACASGERRPAVGDAQRWLKTSWLRHNKNSCFYNQYKGWFRADQLPEDRKGNACWSLPNKRYSKQAITDKYLDHHYF